jgi:hypothetical protein
MQHLESAGLPPAHALFARGIRGAAAVLIILVAPVISMSGTLTTGLNGTSPAVRFPPGFGASLAATIAATAVAAVLAALIARRDALMAIPVSLGLWAITGASVVPVGIQLRHTGLTDWGWILVAHHLSEQRAACPLPPIVGRQAPAPARPPARPPAIASTPSPQDRELAGVPAQRGGP